MIELTRHARTRMQQRGIREDALFFILEYGREMHDHRGCTVFQFDRRARQRAERDLGRERIRRLCHWMNSYVVMADGAVITVAHRRRRWRLH